MTFVIGFSFLYGQEAESNAVGFDLNNVPGNLADTLAEAVSEAVPIVVPEKLPDTSPPIITILAPEIDNDGRFKTELDKVDFIGEVKDESKIRFVSINSDIRMANETGIFATSLSLLPGENLIQIRSMDEFNNIQNRTITVEYTPAIITLADRINSGSKYYGLFIGIDDYKDPEIPNLDNPIKDAKNLLNTLTENYMFEQENMKFLRNPDRGDIISELDEFRKKVTTDDNFLIFFAGHGHWDEDAGIGYWLPADADRKSTVDWFRNSTLVDYLQAIHSKHTLLITDACFAGSIFKARSAIMNEEIVFETLYERPSRKAMTSGPLDEVPDQSAFVKYLIQRLDENKETYLSSEQLFYSFKMAVLSNTSVEPQYGEIRNVGNEGGDFIFLKRK